MDYDVDMDTQTNGLNQEGDSFWEIEMTMWAGAMERLAFFFDSSCDLNLWQFYRWCAI